MEIPQITHGKLGLAIISIGGMVLLLWLILSIIFFNSMVTALKEQNLQKAQIASSKLNILLSPLKLIPKNTCHSCRVILLSLDAVTRLPNTLGTFDQLQNDITDQEQIDISLVKQQTREWQQLTTEFNDQWNQSKILKIFTNAKIEKQLNSNLEIAQDILAVLTAFFDNPGDTIVLLQNTQELRATGGFAGSYLRFNYNGKTISQPSIQDIYEPDGQFQGYIEAPQGVTEYLSSGNGLRLPDANWYPDFPVSAKTVLSYFAFGNEQAIKHVVAINLDVLETILTKTGPIYLPDYQQQVTAENIAQVARADRDSFFPGSKQKSTFLNHLLKQLKIAILKLDVQQQKEITLALQQHFQEKDIQYFSLDETIQSIVKKYPLAGLISVPETTDIYLFPVESNIGINKANQAIDRSLAINLSDYSFDLTITFQNNNTNSEEPLHYGNYLRLLVKPNHKVHSIMIGEEHIATWHESTLQTNQGQLVKQIGFLVPIPQQTKQTVVVKFITPELLPQPTLLHLQLQSGVDPFPVTITTPNTTKNILLEKDTSYTLP